MSFDGVLGGITLLTWMADHDSTLRDHGPTDSSRVTEQLFLKDNRSHAVPRKTLEFLVDFEYLRAESRLTDTGNPFIEFRLTDKAKRFLAVRTSKLGDPELLSHLWIVVVNGIVYFDTGKTPPDLKSLIGEDWNEGDRITITCHAPAKVRISDLRLAQAGEVYGGLTNEQIDKIDKIATERSPAFRDSRT